MLRQDCWLILPPYPFSLGDPSDMSRENEWHARPQLFFKCLLRPQNLGPPRIPAGHVTRGPDDLEATLVFFSTFEELKLPGKGPWIVPPPSCTSRPLRLSCTSLPANLCLAGCHSFPVSCKATLLLPYLTSCLVIPLRGWLGE